jgi:hypothetical protein
VVVIVVVMVMVMVMMMVMMMVMVMVVMVMVVMVMVVMVKLHYSPATAARRAGEHCSDADGAERPPGERHEEGTNWHERIVTRYPF